MDLRSNRSRSHTPLVQNKIDHEVSEQTVEETTVQHSYSTRNKSLKSSNTSGSDEVFAIPVKQRSERFVRKIRQRTSDYSSEEGENEITSSKTDAQDNIRSLTSNNTVLSSNGERKSALQVYQEAGEYWNKYPKTDYTYSLHSKDRIEVAPGVIAMPNMSRRSLRRSVESTNQFDQTKQTAYSDDYQSSQTKQSTYSNDFSDQEDFNTKYSYTTTLKPKALFRDEADSHYEMKTIIKKSLVHRITMTVRSAFTRIFTSIYTAMSVMYWGCVSGVLWCGRGYYKTVSRILLLDTWLLQRSNQKKQWGSLIALILLPLLLLTGWWLCAGLSNVLQALFLPTTSELKAPLAPIVDSDIPLQPPNIILPPSSANKDTLNVDEVVKLILESPVFENIINTHLNTKTKSFNNQQELISLLQNEVTSINKKLNDLSTNIERVNARNNAKMIFEVNKCCRRQYIQIEGYVRRLLADLIGLQGSNIHPDAITSWLNTIFVAKQDLEARLSEVTQNLHSEFDHLVAMSAAAIMKDVSNKINIKLQESVRANSYSIGVDSVLTDTQVHRIVKEALAVYDADKTGLVDYALEPSGGQILSTRCTESYNRETGVMTVLGIPIWYPSNNPRTVITPGVMPGECWAFQNFPGFLVIQLSARINVSAFSLEHIPQSIAAGGKRESAPKGFTVWGLLSENDPDPWQLGKYQYSLDKPSLQFFPVQHEGVPFEIVELRVESNHGHVNYTCLYRFRVHGNLSDEPTFADVATGGGLIIALMFIIVYMLEEDCKQAEMIFMFIYAVLLIVSGIMFLVKHFDSERQYSIITLAVFIVEIVAGVVMLIDFIRAYKK